jgi:hypothetical protein
MMETTVNGVYVVGDVSGIEEASSAMEEGKLAGIDVATKLGYLSLDEMKDKKDRVNEKLCELRTGFYGSPIKDAKESIFQEFTAKKEK